VPCFGDIVEDILAAAGIKVLPPRDLLNPESGQIIRGRPQSDTLAGISRNPVYVREIIRETGRLLNRSNKAALKGTQKFYNKESGQYQPYPPFRQLGQLGTAAQFTTIAETLALLVFNKVIAPASKLNVPLIDKFTGEYCLPEEEEAEVALSHALGIPTTGLFTLSQRFNNINRFGFTFTGVDLTAFAVFGSLVTEVKGLTMISWSSHRDKHSNRRTFERKPTSHARGAQTIAGSMVFTLFDEDPIRAMTPIEFFHGNNPITGPGGISEFNEMDPTEVPRFDIAISLTNEYGAISTMIIFGIDITDSGGAISMRQLENEIVIQFKALGLDPIKPVDVGNDRVVNMLGVGTKGAELFDRRRRNLLLGDLAAGNDFEEVYKNSMEKITDLFTVTV